MIEQILLSNFPSLHRLPELRTELSEFAQRHRFAKNETILREGQYVKVIPLLIHGLVKVYKEDDNGNEVLLYYIKPGESCVMSMTALIKNKTSVVKGIVEEDADILVLPAEEILRIAKKYPEWNEFIYELFNNKYDELLTVISTLTFSNKNVRLINYLNKQVELKGNAVITKTHQEIAMDLGSSREVISRLLKKLENDDFVKLSHSKIEVLKH